MGNQETVVAAAVLVSAFAFAMSVTAAIVAWRIARLGELIPFQAGPRAKCGLLEYALVFSCFIAGQAFGALVAGLPVSTSAQDLPTTRVEVPGELPAELSGEEIAAAPVDEGWIDPATLVGAAIGSLVAVLAAYLVWRLVLERGPRTLAPVSPVSTLGSDVSLGLGGFLMTAAPVYGLQALLLRYFPQKHDILDRLEAGLDPLFLVAAAFSAGIAAPLIEEIVFRGFLQSAFERLRYKRGGALTGLLFGAPTDAESEAEGVAAEAAESPADLFEGGGTFFEGLVRTVAGIGSLPVVASASIFALLHLGQGPAPIPLFFFALMLGYLYRQTGRLAAPITAHFALNATTLLLAGLSVLNEPRPPETTTSATRISSAVLPGTEAHEASSARSSAP